MSNSDEEWRAGGGRVEHWRRALNGQSIGPLLLDLMLPVYLSCQVRAGRWETLTMKRNIPRTVSEFSSFSLSD